MSNMLEKKGWKKVKEECLIWPETNKPAKEVYQKFGMPQLIYRYDMTGELLFSNEDKVFFREQFV